MRRVETLAVLAVVAGLVLFGGGATALAATVRCVNSIDASCQFSYSTMQGAVNAASAGDLILIGPGTYVESVTIPAGKDGLALLGAQAGVDARNGRGDPSLESVVNAAGVGSQNAGFIVQATNVVIDGFTVQGATDGTANGGGIDLKGGAQRADGATILNNILQNNAVGLYLNLEGFAPVSNVLIEHNLFRNNNAGPQASSGDGIFTSACQNVVITENTFTGHQRLGIGINNSTGVTIANNESQQDARFVVFTGTMSSEFSHNHGQNFVASSFFSTSRATAVAIGFNNSALTITGNVLEGGQTGSTIRGIQFGGYPGPNPANTNLTVSYNTIRNMPLSGIVAETAMLTNSHIVGNVIEQNAADGMFIGTGNSGNILAQNVSEDNGGLDCHDASTGGGTLGTNNTWSKNVGKTSSPAGLCFGLRVIKVGAGLGTVTSTPVGINCDPSCAAPFPNGTTVTLTAVAAPGTVFIDWSGGGCSGVGACTFTLVAPTDVTATFDLILQPSLGLTLNQGTYRTGDTLRVDLSVGNVGPGGPGDVYFGAILPPQAGPSLGCPGGDAVAFVADGFTRVVVTCLSGPPQSFAPLFRGIVLPAALPPTTVANFFRFVWGPGLPAGPYTFFVALTPRHTFANGRIMLFGVAAAGLTFQP